MEKIGKVVLLGLFLLCAHVTQAQEAEVKVKVDRNVMGVGDTFTYSISVSSHSAVNIETPRLPALAGLDLINTWVSSSTNSYFDNGKFGVDKTQTFSYMLATTAKGNVNIGAAEVLINGKKILTKPVSIRVVAGSPNSPKRGGLVRPRGQPSAPKSGAEDDLFSKFLRNRPRPGFRSQPVNSKAAFFIQVEVDKTEVFEGEQVTASWYLYTRGQISDIDTLKYPSLNGFWKEDIHVATRLNFVTEVVEGVAYKRALLASYALFPIKAGIATIDSYKARCTVLSNTRRGFGRPYKFTKASKLVKIKVLPIPKAGRPENYSGAVGDFSVTANLESKSVPVNEPVTLKIRFNGRGNAKLIDLPSIDFPPSLEVYDTKKESKFFKNGTSFKEFEILLIPRDVGELEIPTLTVGLFNPDTKKFYQRKIPSIAFKTFPGANSQMIPSSPLGQSDQGDQNQGPMLPNLILGWDDSYNLSSVQFFSFWGISYLFAILFLFWRAFVELGLGRKQKGVNEILKLRFKAVYEKLDKDDWRGVGVEVTNTFYYLLGEISGEGGANLQIEKLLMKAPPSVRRELGEAITKQMKKFEILSFAPEAAVGKLKEKNEMKKNVIEMEKTLHKAVKLGLGSSFEEDSSNN